MSPYKVCPFCKMGKDRRLLAYRIMKNLRRCDMTKILRWNLIGKSLNLKTEDKAKKK